MRVLAWPARRKRHDNPYSFLVQESTAPHGATTEEFSLANLLRHRWDVVHVHWPDMALLRGGFVKQLAGCAAVLGLLRLQRLRGAAVVWTVHNLRPHEVTHQRLADWYLARFVDLLDGVLSPSAYGLEQAEAAYPALRVLPSAITPIGHYRNVYDAPPTRQEARRALGIDTDTDAELGEGATVLVSIGQIRAYKNLVHLAELVASNPDPSLRLIIAGPPKDDDEVAALQAVAARDPRIEVRAERVPDEDIPTLLAAADIFVAPFSRILNSSSVLLALSFDCGVLVPATGALPELADAIGGDWVSLYDGQLDDDDLAKAVSSSGPRTGSPDLSRFEWSDIGRATVELFEQAVANRQGRALVTNEP